MPQRHVCRSTLGIYQTRSPLLYAPFHSYPGPLVGYELDLRLLLHIKQKSGETYINGLPLLLSPNGFTCLSFLLPSID